MGPRCCPDANTFGLDSHGSRRLLLAVGALPASVGAENCPFAIRTKWLPTNLTLPRICGQRKRNDTAFLMRYGWRGMSDSILQARYASTAPLAGFFVCLSAYLPRRFW